MAGGTDSQWCSAQGKDRRSASEHGRDPARAEPALGTLCSKSATSCHCTQSRHRVASIGSAASPLMARCSSVPPPQTCPRPLPRIRSGNAGVKGGLQTATPRMNRVSPPESRQRRPRHPSLAGCFSATRNTEMNFVVVDQKDLEDIQFIQFTMQEDTQKRQNLPKFLLERFADHICLSGATK